jgi:hypothetical protein
MNEHPEVGPRLREVDAPQRFEFTDVGLVVNLRPGRDGEPEHVHWTWTDEVDWEPRVTLSMSSDTANRFFQGKENLLMAVARRKIRTAGDVSAAVALAPIVRPVYERYGVLVRERYPHLVL